MQASAQTAALLLQHDPNPSERNALVSAVFGDCENPAQAFDHLRSSILQCVHHFEPLAFPEGFGFDTFSVQDCLQYFLTPAQFSFALKKEKGAQILYGKDHVAVRQQLLNNLPTPYRIKAMESKIAHFELLFKCQPFLIDPNAQLEDILDIGMSHSVYHLVFSDQTSVVLKRKNSASQVFYCKLLTELGWPSYKTTFTEDRFGGWEISEYLGPQGLYNALLLANNRDALEKDLAYHAALGDVLGRGDRHIENYVMHNARVVPIDISYLFWPDNQHWTKTYTEGGMYEINHLADVVGHPQLYQEKLDNFFKHYQDCLQHIASKAPQIQACITQTFDSSEAPYKQDYVQKNLQDINSFYQSQKQLYLNALEKMKTRLQEKWQLEDQVKKDPSLLDDPVTKMYFLANKDRYSCFFLKE